MALAIDNTGKSNSQTGGSSLNVTLFAVGAGADRGIVLFVAQWNLTDRAPAATFNTSETFVVFDATTVADGGGTRRVTLLRLIAPSNATATIAVSWGGTVTEAVAGAFSVTGMDQTTPLSAVQKNSGTTGTTSSVTQPTVAAGDWAISGACWSMATSGDTLSANQTQRTNQNAGGTTTMGGSMSAAGAGANLTSTWTSSHSGDSRAHIGALLSQSTGGGGGSVTYPELERHTRGVGRGVLSMPYQGPRMVRRDRIFVPAWLGDAA